MAGRVCARAMPNRTTAEAAGGDCAHAYRVGRHHLTRLGAGDEDAERRCLRQREGDGGAEHAMCRYQPEAKPGAEDESATNVARSSSRTEPVK